MTDNSPAATTSSTPPSSAPSSSSASSEATAPIPSSPPRPAPSSPSALSGIRYADRVLVLGKTRSGKSSLTRAVFLSAAPPRLVIDPADSELTAKIPGQVTFRDPKRPPVDADTARFVPDEPDNVRAYNEVYQRAFDNFPRYVWLDEPNEAAPAHGYPRAANKFVGQGAKRQLGHITCTTQIRWIMRSLVRNAQVLIMFDTPAPEDRRYVAQMVGITVAELEAAHAQLGLFEFLYWAGGPLVICPPLSL